MSKRKEVPSKRTTSQSPHPGGAIASAWKTLNEGFTGYVFYIFLGIVAAFVLTNLMGAAFDTSVPMVAVVSGSMDHGFTEEEGHPCGKNVPGYTESFESWWTLCSSTYDDFGIAESKFSGFPFRDGLKKGDIVIIQNNADIGLGDIVVYDRGVSSRKVPIIHRIVQINEDGTYQTKGDHNDGQLSYEGSIDRSQIRGKAVFVVPYFGYLRVLLPIE